MDSRADFQRLLEEMDKVIESKRQELKELDERLASSRSMLSEQEARELDRDEEVSSAVGDKRRMTEDREQGGRAHETDSIKKQRKLYENQLEQFSEALNELESINRQLTKENEDLLGRLNVGESTVAKLESNLKTLSESLQELKSANLELNIRLAKAESESALQRKLLRRSHDEDEVLIAAFNDKIESMKSIIDKKEEEIEQLRSENRFTIELFAITAREINHDDSSNEVLNQFSSKVSTQDSRQRAIEIASAFREKNAQIELLKGHLLQASIDLEKNASLIERLTGLSGGKETSTDSNGVEEAAESSHIKAELATRAKMLETELEAKDKRLHLLENRVQHYETVLPVMIGDLVLDLRDKLNSRDTAQDLSTEINSLANNIRELLNHLNSSQSLLDQVEQVRRDADLKDAQIRKLVKELNQLDARFHNARQQYEFLRSRAHDKLGVVDDTDQISLTNSEINEEPPDGSGSKEDNTTTMCRIEPIQFENIEQQRATECQVSCIGASSEHELDRALPLETKPTDSPLVEGRERALQIDGDSCITSSVYSTGKAHHLNSHTGEQVGVKRLTGEPLVDHTRTTKHSDSSMFISTNTMAIETIQANSKPESIDPALLNQQSETYNLSAISTALEVQDRLRQLENENELLELAMKEILLSIKWSDAQCSTILIDCPSLERLCQLIEARFLAKQARVEHETLDNIGEQTYFTDRKSQPSFSSTIADKVLDSEQLRESVLFQLVVLKSELDLLRGQNEQLRADVKTQRLEYQQLLNEPVERHKLSKSDSTNAANQENKLNNERASSEIDKRAVGGPAKAKTTNSEAYDDLREKSLEKDHASPSKGKIESSNQISGSEVSVNTGRCFNCKRWAKAAHHLTQCIMRIETRVNLSDETFTGRLANLHHLVRMLERDLASRESLLEKRNHECHYLKQQRLMAESRNQYLKGQLAVHMQVCPLIIASSCPSEGSSLLAQANTSTSRSESEGKTIASSTSVSRPGGIYQHLSQVSGTNLDRCSPQITINLLHSIVNCLQARLDYKDERLQQLERAVSESTTHQQYPPVARPRRSTLFT